MEVWAVCTVVSLNNIGLVWPYLAKFSQMEVWVVCTVASVNHFGPTSPSLLVLLCLEGGVTYVWGSLNNIERTKQRPSKWKGFWREVQQQCNKIWIARIKFHHKQFESIFVICLWQCFLITRYHTFYHNFSQYISINVSIFLGGERFWKLCSVLLLLEKVIDIWDLPPLRETWP